MEIENNQVSATISGDGYTLNLGNGVTTGSISGNVGGYGYHLEVRSTGDIGGTVTLGDDKHTISFENNDIFGSFTIAENTFEVDRNGIRPKKMK